MGLEIRETREIGHEQRRDPLGRLIAYMRYCMAGLVALGPTRGAISKDHQDTPVVVEASNGMHMNSLVTFDRMASTPLFESM